MSLSRRDFLKGSAALGLLVAVGRGYADDLFGTTPLPERIIEGPLAHNGRLRSWVAINRTDRLGRVQLRFTGQRDVLMDVTGGARQTMTWEAHPSGFEPVGSFEVYTTPGTDGYLAFADGTFQSFGTEGDEWWEEIA